MNFGNNEIDDDLNFELIDEEENDPERLETVKPITTADLFVWRKQMLEKRKYDIGVLCSDMLENPEGKVLFAEIFYNDILMFHVCRVLRKCGRRI